MQRMGMKKWLLLGLFVWVGMESIGAGECRLEFMKDRCAQNGYSVVEGEENIYIPHNCMALAHYFPGEEPEGYCGYHKSSRGKGVRRASSPVVTVDY